jgi:hypothetical protein
MISPRPAQFLALRFGAQPLAVFNPNADGGAFPFPQTTFATVVLLPGSTGDVQFDGAGNTKAFQGNFLVRIAGQFLANGINVVLLSAPNSTTWTPNYRRDPAHANEVAEAIRLARSTWGLPVYVVGTSKGSISAANVAGNKDPAEGGPDGLILTSSPHTADITVMTALFPRNRVSVPSMVIWHAYDTCPETAGTGGRAVADWIRSRGAPYVEERVEQYGAQAALGGDADQCGPFSHHGYNNVETVTANAMVKFIYARLSQ